MIKNKSICICLMLFYTLAFTKSAACIEPVNPNLSPNKKIGETLIKMAGDIMNQ